MPYPTGPAYRERVNADEHEEIAASVAAHTELGPKYDAAVAEGLVERIGEEIDRRVDARLRNLSQDQPVPAGPPAPRTGAMVAATVLALGSMGLGVGATAVVAGHAVTAAAQTVMVMLIWGAIAVINIVYARLR